MSESATTTINVLAGAGEVVPLEIPLELACSLILTRGGQHAYTMEDVLAASAALKKFREVQDPETIVSEVLSSVCSFPAVVPCEAESQLASGTPCVAPVALPPELPSADGHLPSAELDLLALCFESKGAQTVQDFLTSCGPGDARLGVVMALSRQSVALAQHAAGCRVFQKALDVSSLEERLILASSIPASKITELCVDVNANHVMQKFIEVLPSEFTEFIIDQVAAPFTNTVARLAVHCYGCRVIQRVLSRCALSQKERVLDAICTTVGELVCDQFGNYVVQHCLDFGREIDRERVVAALASRDLQLLSCNKFASNVLEKAARLHMNASAGLLVQSLCSLRDEQLLDIMKDRYGNYVARAFLELSCQKYPGLNRVRDLVREHAAMLKKFTYGWHLVERLERSGSSSVTNPHGPRQQHQQRGL